MRLILPMLLAALASPALAQGAVPSNVNECTLLQDAAELRRCIESFEGRGPTYTPPVATAPKPPPAGRKAWLPTTMSDRNPARTKAGRGHDNGGKNAGLRDAELPGETLDLRQGTPGPGDAEAARALEIR